MRLDKYNPHVFVIPEDRADQELANGFVDHDQIRTRRIQVMSPAGGWRFVLQIFQDEYAGHLRDYPLGHVVLIVDFDGNFDARRAEFDRAIPDDLKPRVFVIGPAKTPQILKSEMGGGRFEPIGKALADECCRRTNSLWRHEQLSHNEADRQRLFEAVRPILFDDP